MSAESLIGGGDSGGGGAQLSDESLDLLNQFLLDTVGGTVVSGTVGGASFVAGTGANGETQGALVPGSEPITGTITAGTLTLNVELPAGTGLTFEGNEGTPEALGDFLDSVIDSYLPPDDLEPGSPAAETAQSLKNAVQELIQSLKDLGIGNVKVNVVDFMTAQSSGTSQGAGANEIVFDAGLDAGSQVFALNLATLTPETTVVIKNVANAVLAGSGTVRVDGATGARITNDNRDQNVTGGLGNDTLVGGGGNDTLTGGGGDDIFGFSALGHYTVTDFDKAHDKVGFNVAGVTSVEQLSQLVTGVDQTAQDVTFHFGPDASITLVGVSAADLTSDMIKFNF